MLQLVQVGLAALTLFCAATLVLGSARILGRSQGLLSKILGAWLIMTALVAWSGVLEDWTARPPRLPMIPVTAFLAAVIMSLLTPIKRLESIPRWWIPAFQTFRVGVELAFWGLFVAGIAPLQVTFEGRNFDVLVGLTAPLVAFGVAKRGLRPAWVIAWNLVGLGVLANTIVTVLTSAPGPLHGGWPGEPFTALARWPVLWIPAFLAPLAVFLHLVSIRQNLAAAPRK